MGNLIVPILIGIAGIVIGLIAGYFYRRSVSEKKVGQAETTVHQMIEEAQKRAENIKKETLLEAKEEVHRLRNELDKESRERRNEMQRTERRLSQREETLDKKMDSLEVKEEALNSKNRNIENLQREVEELQKEQIAELERVSSLTVDEAKNTLMQKIEHDARRDAVTLVRDIESKAKEEADKKSRDIIGLAIQRYRVSASIVLNLLHERVLCFLDC